MAQAQAQQAQGHNTYLPGYHQVAHHEWRTAENSAAYLLPILQQKAKTNPHLKLLDVGAGSGTITASLAKYMPEGHITATDLSEDILEKAKGFATKDGVSNISYQTADIYHLPFEDNTFDVVHASMVLSHLDGPVEAYREMLRVAKPGGVVANRESDLRMWSWAPEIPGMEILHRVQLDTMKAAGGNISAGPQLVGWALQAGAKRDSITASFGTWTYSTPEERAMWAGSLVQRLRDGEMRKKALKLKLADEAEMDRSADAWDKWVEAEDGCFGCTHGEVLIWK